MARPKTTSRDEQRRFGIHELFFSTTDRAGVIRSGNEVFRRVANFPTIEEMIGKPHNVIRHPDMPRAVFKLLWDHLLDDKPIAAYVKNMATDGAYYWVMALVVPANDGYLSVRFKPSSPIFGVVQELYKTLLAIEAESGNKPGLRQEYMLKALDSLHAAVRGLGYDSYDDFMRFALATEMASRARLMAEQGIIRKPIVAGGPFGQGLQHYTSLDLSLDQMFAKVELFLDLIGRLESKSEFLHGLAEHVQLLSMNSLISSHQLGDEGRGLAVVADDLATISTRSTNVVDLITGQIHNLIGALRNAAFDVSAARLQAGIAIVFLEELIEAERNATTLEREEGDLILLGQSFATSARNLASSLENLRSPIDGLKRTLDDLSAAVRSLGRIHLIGRVEAAHATSADRFRQFFDEVNQELQRAKTEIGDFGSTIKGLEQGLSVIGRDSVALVGQLAA